MTTTMTGKLKEIFKLGDTGKADLMERARRLALSISAQSENKVNHHQLRNLLDFVIWVKQSHRGRRSDELKPVSRGRLAVLRPRIAYMAAREKNLRSLQGELDELLCDKQAFQTGEDLARLYEFTAALVAFHKFAETDGGKDNA